MADTTSEIRAMGRAFFVGFLGAAIAISALVWPIVYYNLQATEYYVREGYEQVPSENNVYHWRKRIAGPAEASK